MATANATADAQATPDYIRPDFGRMPPELKLLQNWLLWAAVWNGTKWTKPPFQINGHLREPAKAYVHLDVEPARLAIEKALGGLSDAS